jgi:hypothetical protein
MSELIATAERILESVKGAEEIEVYVATGADTEVQAYQGVIENLSSATSSGIGIRVLRDGPSGAQVGTAWAGSLDQEAIDDALREARDNARFATEDEFIAFARPDGVEGAALELSDESILTTPLDVKIAMAIDLERLVRDRSTRPIILTTSPKPRFFQPRGFELRSPGPGLTFQSKRSRPTAQPTKPAGGCPRDDRRANSTSMKQLVTQFRAPRECWEPSSPLL